MKNPKLTQTLARQACGATLALGLVLSSPGFVQAEDIDLFVGAATVAATNPNILVVIDNSANWNNQKQHWDAKLTQGESELRALRTILGDLRQNFIDNPSTAVPKVNMGLLFHKSGAPDGGIVRYAIRPMDLQNIDAFLELIGEPVCTDGPNSLNLTPNCIWKNMQGTGPEQTNNSSYTGALFDAYKYFGGRTAPFYATLANDLQLTTPANSNAFGKARHFNVGAAADSRMDKDAYTDGADGFLNFKSPILTACAKNFIIFVGNGFPGEENNTSHAATLLKNVNLGTILQVPTPPTQLSVPDFSPPITTNVSTVLTPPDPFYAPCSTRAACASAAAATYGSLFTDLAGNPSYTCSGGSQNSPLTAVNTACRTVDQCKSDAASTFSGFTTYSCSGGTSSTTFKKGTDTSGVCHNQTECVAQAVIQFGAGTYSCLDDGTTTGCTGQRQKGRTINQTTTCISPALINQTMSAITGAQCDGSNFTNQTITGNKQVISVLPLTTSSPPKFNNYADEMAKFLYLTDVNDLPGQQNVSTYTIDVFKDQQSGDETALLFNMAKHGGGRYFQATSESAIIDAFRKIMIEIQSVNSVFASASLPINATNRSQNENQVFIGMFRPDGSGSPRWYGNLKRYQIFQFSATEFRLADSGKNPDGSSRTPIDAVGSTQFISPCASSFWSIDSGEKYWLFQNGSAGQCTTAGSQYVFSDAPDGPLVEKGAVAEVLRIGNPGKDDFSVEIKATDLTAFPRPGVNRTIYTCSNVKECCPSCTSGKPYTLVEFNKDNVSADQLGVAAQAAAIPAFHQELIDYTLGWNTIDETKLDPIPPDSTYLDWGVRPSVHGDVAHSRPLPVNYGKDKGGVVLFYGANDGTFRAVRGSNGAEVWAFIAPEHHQRLERLRAGEPVILYPNQSPVPVSAARKDYFFDGSAGLFQNKDDSKIWVFPSMRRGGRMVYAFDVTNIDKPSLMWKLGCTEASLTDTASCRDGAGAAAFEALGQTWSIPSVAIVKGYQSADPDKPVIIMGGGYDTCEDEDAAPNSACSSGRMGNRVYVIDATSGTIVKEFATVASVAADITLVSRSTAGYADHAYAADTAGNLYRIDFVKPTSPDTALGVDDWTITHIAHVATDSSRKFLFGPGALAAGNKIYLTITSGDREAPLVVNYPFPFKDNPGVLNRAYMLVDTFATTDLPVDLDGSTMADMSTGSSCSTLTAEAQGKNGWFFDLNENGVGEQGVTSSIIFAGLVFFSTNRPELVEEGACENKLGQARGYAVNLLNASGAADTLNICGGARSQVFVGGGLPPSPVTGTVPVGADGKPVTVMIGGVQRGGGLSSPIGAQRVTPTITQRRARVYWYNDTDR